MALSDSFRYQFPGSSGDVYSAGRRPFARSKDAYSIMDTEIGIQNLGKGMEIKRRLKMRIKSGKWMLLGDLMAGCPCLWGQKVERQLSLAEAVALARHAVGRCGCGTQRTENSLLGISHLSGRFASGSRFLRECCPIITVRISRISTLDGSRIGLCVAALWAYPVTCLSIKISGHGW